MGQVLSARLSSQQLPVIDLSDYQEIQCSQSYPSRRLLRSKSNKFCLLQFQLAAHSQAEISHHKASCILRLNHHLLLATKGIQTSELLVGDKQTFVKIYFERSIKRFPQIDQLKISQALYVLIQCSQAIHILQNICPFILNQNQIFINESGEVKLWYSHVIWKLFPDQSVLNRINNFPILLNIVIPKLSLNESNWLRMELSKRNTSTEQQAAISLKCICNQYGLQTSLISIQHFQAQCKQPFLGAMCSKIRQYQSQANWCKPNSFKIESERVNKHLQHAHQKPENRSSKSTKKKMRVVSAEKNKPYSQNLLRESLVELNGKTNDQHRFKKHQNSQLLKKSVISCGFQPKFIHQSPQPHIQSTPLPNIFANTSSIIFIKRPNESEELLPLNSEINNVGSATNTTIYPLSIKTNSNSPFVSFKDLQYNSNQQIKQISRLPSLISSQQYPIHMSQIATLNVNPPQNMTINHSKYVVSQNLLNKPIQFQSFPQTNSLQNSTINPKILFNAPQYQQKQQNILENSQPQSEDSHKQRYHYFSNQTASSTRQTDFKQDKTRAQLVFTFSKHHQAQISQPSKPLQSYERFSHVPTSKSLESMCFASKDSVLEELEISISSRISQEKISKIDQKLAIKQFDNFQSIPSSDKLSEWSNSRSFGPPRSVESIRKITSVDPRVLADLRKISQ